MRLIDADALRDAIGDGTTWRGSSWKQLKEEVVTALDAAPSIACAADNPNFFVPSKCPMRGVSRCAATDHRLKWAACRLYEDE